MYLLFKKEVNYKYIIVLLIVFVIGSAPGIIKMFAIPTEGYFVMSNFEWYINMARNEVDDFSGLYHLIYNKKKVLVQIMVPIFIGLLYVPYIKYILISLLSKLSYFKNNNRFNKQYVNDLTNHKKRNLLLLTVIPSIIFILIIITEYFSVQLKIGTFMPIIITTSFGNKIGVYSFYPIIFLVAVTLKDLFHPKNNRYLLIANTILFVIIIFIFGSDKNNKSKINAYKDVFFSQTNFSYVDLLGHKKVPVKSSNPTLVRINNSSSNHINQYMGTYSLSEMKKIRARVGNLETDYDYEKKYNDYDVLRDLILNINEKIPKHTGIIFLPYLVHARPILSDYDLFFQNHEDGNIMLGSAKIATIILERMKMLLGVTYKDIPPQYSWLQWSAIRNLYLKVNEKVLNNINEKYPAYQFFVTENTHKLSFPIIFQNDHYIVYKISKIEHTG